MVYTVSVLCVLWLLFFSSKNEVPVDVGDGIMHYFISKGSWLNPELFLHHWGKPFYTLLTSPFSQFGFFGLQIFNILIFAGTLIAGFKILQKFNVQLMLQAIFPLILLNAVDYSDTIMGGHTEPLFNFALVFSWLLFLEKKYFWFAILVSFMPFMRSEGQLPMLLAVMLLSFVRAYRYVPFLMTGFVIYAFIGVFVYGDFFWYFTKSAYSMSNDIYGKGTWSHYALSYKNYLGNPGLYVTIIGVFTALWLLIRKRWQELQFNWAFYAYGVFLGVVVLHSYFWATGQNGSLGLTRIATQGMPLFVLLQLYYLSKIPKSRHIAFQTVLVLFGVIMSWSLIRTKHYPKLADPLDRQILNAADYLKTLDLGDQKIYYHFPLLSFSYGENPMGKHEKMFHSSYEDLLKTVHQDFKPGDILVRDSHFGPQEANISLDILSQIPEFVKIKEFVSSEQVDDRYGEVEGVVVYQYVPLNKQIPVQRKMKELKIDTTYVIDASHEFYDIHVLLPKNIKNSNVQFKFEVSGDHVHLNYDANGAQDYSNKVLKNGEKLDATYHFSGENVTKLYFWNPDKKNATIRVYDVVLEEVSLHPYMKLR